MKHKTKDVHMKHKTKEINFIIEPYVCIDPMPSLVAHSVIAQWLYEAKPSLVPMWYLLVYYFALEFISNHACFVTQYVFKHHYLD